MIGFEVFRTRFGDIVCEFMPSARTSNKVALITTGCPGYPGGKEELMTELAHRGFWSFVIRYRGTWESDGIFLEHPPSDDVVLVMDGIEKPFRDLWSTAEYRVENPEFYLLGGSFGGAAAILASRDPRVKKAATVSAVTDWLDQKHTVEPLDLMDGYLRSAFGMAYRGPHTIPDRLMHGDFYNPMHEKDSIDGKKLLLIHSKDDRVVHAEPAMRFAEATGASLVLLNSGEHMGAGSMRHPHIFKHVEKFFGMR